MRISVRRALLVALLAALGLIGTTRQAHAQYRPPSSGSVGEAYHVEAAYAWWDADPSLIINSEALGILGTDIDLIKDLGIQKKRLGKINLVLRPARKHKFRFEYLPITYQADTVVQRSFVFNGQRYTLGLPVQTSAQFTTYRFGYEYDFVYRKRGYAGVLVDAKYTDVKLELRSPIGPEFTRVRAPIPTIGFVGRGYLASRVSITGEVSFFRVPDSLTDYDGGYTDYDVYATVNINKYLGGQAGYRSIDVFYNDKVRSDTGALKFKGLYFGGVVRY